MFTPARSFEFAATGDALAPFPHAIRGAAEA